MKRIISIAFIAGIAALIILQLANNKKEGENRVYIYDKEAKIPVFGEVIKSTSSTLSKSFSGMFESQHEVKLSAETQGKITKIFVNEGDKVSKGQLLIKIDDELLRLQLNVLNTKLEGLKKDEERYLTLTNDDAVPAVKLEKIENAIATLKAEQKTLLERINKTSVRAPYDGIVSIKFCEVGGFAAPAVPLLEIINDSGVKFVAHVAEEDLFLFDQDQQYTIQTNAGNTDLKATLLQVSRKGQMGNSFKVEFNVNMEQQLRPGMIGEVVFKNEFSSQDAFSIPAKAILGSESSPEIYKVFNGKALRTSLTIIARSGDHLIVKGSLKAGDTLITGGFINLFDNANVIVNQ